MQGSFRNSEERIKKIYFGSRNNKKSWWIYVWYYMGCKWFKDSKGRGKSWRNWDKGGGKGEERGGDCSNKLPITKQWRGSLQACILNKS